MFHCPLTSLVYNNTATDNSAATDPIALECEISNELKSPIIYVLIWKRWITDEN